VQDMSMIALNCSQTRTRTPSFGIILLF
jgi:hypothetical protein